MLNIILFGPPGCGKGTQSARLSCRYNLVHISSGVVFRHESANGTPEGVIAEKYMSKGLLIPDSMVFKKLLETAMQLYNDKGFVFDGFPRTLHQAHMLDRMLEKKQEEISIVIAMVVDDEELFARMINRAVDSGRIDDNEKTIRTRMQVYYRYTKPVYDYYNRQNKVSRISGMAPVKVVAERIASVVDHYLQERMVLSEVGF